MDAVVFQSTTARRMSVVYCRWNQGRTSVRLLHRLPVVKDLRWHYGKPVPTYVVTYIWCRPKVGVTIMLFES